MSLQSLNKISELSYSIMEIPWFINTGKEIDSLLNIFISNYCMKLNISNEINKVKNWEEAIQIISSNKWNKNTWEIEEKEKTFLLNNLLKKHSEKQLFTSLQKLTEASISIIEKCYIDGLKKNDIKYEYYSKVAAGSAATSCYQAALALAADQDHNHIFISKFKLFKAGYWPLIITDNNFNIF